MTLKVSQNFPFYKTNKRNTISNGSSKLEVKGQDAFVPSFGKKGNNQSFLKRLFAPTNNFFKTDIHANIPNSKTTKYAQALADGIKTELERDVLPQNLTNIMTPKEFRTLLPTLTTEKFTSTYENIKNGVYIADLDYVTNYSTGNESIFEILGKVSELSNQFYAENREPLIFAVADRDCVESIQHIIRTVGENPEKFQHIKILPAIKLSYTHEAPTSQIGFENSEMLVYGINPFDKDLMKFVNIVNQNRKDMVLSFIKRVSTLYPDFAYNISEFAKQNRLDYSNSYTISNLYWRAREYAEKKGNVATKSTEYVPEKIIREAQAIINELDELCRAADSENEENDNLAFDEDTNVNKKIKEVFDDYSTHEENGEIIATAENVFKKMVECLNKQGGDDEKPVLALSSPYYLSHYFEEYGTTTYDNVVAFINKLIKDSEGLVCAFETLAPKYNLDKNLDKQQVEEFNNYILSRCKLYEVGGSFAQGYEELKKH